MKSGTELNQFLRAFLPTFPCLRLAELVYFKQTKRMGELSHQIETSGTASLISSNWKRRRTNLSRLVVVAAPGLISFCSY